MKSMYLLMLGGLMGFAPGASGQQVAGTCEGPGEGVIAGVVDYEDARLAGRSRGVYLTRDGLPFCFGSTAEAGRFVFTRVPAGSYELRLASLGVYPPGPLPVHIVGNDTVEVVIPARLEDALAECAAFLPGCTEVLSAEPPPHLTPEEATEFTYWRAGLALAGGGAPFNREWVACLRPMPTPQLLSGLTTLHAEIVSSNECRLDREGGGRIRHVDTGRDARIISVEVRETAGGRRLNISYNIASLDARWLSCELAEENGRAEIRRCITTAVS